MRTPARPGATTGSSRCGSPGASRSIASSGKPSPSTRELLLDQPLVRGQHEQPARRFREREAERGEVAVVRDGLVEERREHLVHRVLHDPELRPEAPAAIASRSYSVTPRPPSARNAASAQPTIPPPTTATSGLPKAHLHGLVAPSSPTTSSGAVCPLRDPARRAAPAAERPVERAPVDGGDQLPAAAEPGRVGAACPGPRRGRRARAGACARRAAPTVG